MKNKKIEELLSINIGSTIKAELIALICNQFSVILSSGINISKCTKLVANQTMDERLKKILINIQIDIESGQGVAASFEKNGEKIFEPTFIETIRAGELSGNLQLSFGILADYYNDKSKINKQIKGALVYPLFVLFIAIVVLIVVFVFVMPKLVEIFETMEGELPILTRIMIWLSDFFSNNFLLILIGLFLIVTTLILSAKTIKGKKFWDNLKLSLPIPGKVLRKSYQSDFSRTLSMLLKSGVLLSQALMITGRTYNNTVFSSACRNLSSSVSSGKELGISMKNIKCFDKTLCEMASIGEETGELEKMLDVCFTYFDDEAKSIIKKILAAFEPALLIFTALFAGFIAFSIYLPLFQMYELF